jgi:N-methylhydantoinase A
MCALGLLISRVEYHSVKTLLMTKAHFDLPVLNGTLNSMKSDLTSIFARDNVDINLIRFEAFTDLRYVGQGYELKVSLNSDMFESEHLEEVWNAFHRQHKQEYGHNFLTSDIEMVSVKLKAYLEHQSSSRELSFTSDLLEKPTAPELIEKQVLFSSDGKPQSLDTEFIERSALEIGFEMDGPVVLSQEDSTTVVPPGWAMSVDEDLTIRLKKLDNLNE